MSVTYNVTFTGPWVSWCPHQGVRTGGEGPPPKCPDCHSGKGPSVVVKDIDHERRTITVTGGGS